MKPIYFRQATNLSKGNATSLPLHYWTDQKQCVSCWKPTIKERFSILFNGEIWLGVKSGNTQPPIFISSEQVFHNHSKSIPLISKIRFEIAWKIDNLRWDIVHFFKPYKEDVEE